MNVAIVSSLEYRNKISEDIALAEALREAGLNCEIVAWDDSGVKWSRFDIAILRSAWGYHKKYCEFLSWMEMLDTKRIPLINNTNMVRWNIQKDRQLETLRLLKLPTIPYAVSDNIKNLGSMAKQLGTTKLVIKPVVSASGNDTYMIDTLSIPSEQSQNLQNIFKERKFIIQPFIDGIKNGEYALVYIGGTLSHAVIRFPGVFAEKKTALYIPNSEIPAEIVKLADLTSQRITQCFGTCPAYARYDIVENMIMEVELAEPDLMTRNISQELKATALKKLAVLIAKGENK